MGYGSYRSTDWSYFKTSRHIDDSSSISSLYTQRKINEALDPKNIRLRESCDSPDNPLSTPIIFGLDVTGSMGCLPTTLAKGALNKTMVELYDKRPVTDPQIMFQAIGDSVFDTAPLQVTQFESDIRIAEQLLNVYFEGGGGGNGGESYELAWYFASRYTKIDSFEKRGEKGFLFTIGDEPVLPFLYKKEIEKVFGKTFQGDKKVIDSKTLYLEAAKKYEIFHISVSYGCKSRDAEIREVFENILGKRIIFLDCGKLDYLPQVFISIMQYVKGQDKKTIIDQWDADAAIIIESILEDISEIGNGQVIRL